MWSVYDEALPVWASKAQVWPDSIGYWNKDLLTELNTKSKTNMKKLKIRAKTRSTSSYHAVHFHPKILLSADHDLPEPSEPQGHQENQITPTKSHILHEKDTVVVHCTSSGRHLSAGEREIQHRFFQQDFCVRHQRSPFRTSSPLRNVLATRYSQDPQTPAWVAKSTLSETMGFFPPPITWILVQSLLFMKICIEWTFEHSSKPLLPSTSSCRTCSCRSFCMQPWDPFL